MMNNNKRSPTFWPHYRSNWVLSFSICFKQQIKLFSIEWSTSWNIFLKLQKFHKKKIKITYQAQFLGNAMRKKINDKKKILKDKTLW